MLKQDAAERAFLRAAAERDEAMLEECLIMTECDEDMGKLDEWPEDDASGTTEIPF